MNPFTRIPRRWFRDEDGTYFRNCPLIHEEANQAAKAYRFRLASRLHQEWLSVWEKGVTRKSKLSRGDIEVKMMSFREAFPDEPDMWIFDE